MAVIRKLEQQPEELVQIEQESHMKRSLREHDESNWLISYADMMTLLCVFFIMLFSMSKVNVPEFEKMKKQVSEHFGTKYVSPTEDLGKFMTNVIQEAGVQKDTTISSDGVGVSIVFHSTLFFGSLSAEISKEGEAILNKIIVSLNEKQKKLGKNYKIVIEGHTDSQPVVGGPFPSNWELSSSRATRVVRMFIDQGYLAPNLLAIGYADTQPVAPSRNPDGSWNDLNLGKNRRVVLRVLLPEVDSIPWSGRAEVKPEAKVPAKPVTPGAPTTAPASAVSSGAKGTAAPAAVTVPTNVAVAPVPVAATVAAQAPIAAPVAAAVAPSINSHVSEPAKPAAATAVAPAQH